MVLFQYLWPDIFSITRHLAVENSFTMQFTNLILWPIIMHRGVLLTKSLKLLYQTNSYKLITNFNSLRSTQLIKKFFIYLF